VWDYNIVDNQLVWDDQMYRLYGITPEMRHLAYENWEEGVHPDDLERSSAELWAAIRGECDFDTEFRVVWPDKSIHNIRALAVVQRDEAGKPLRMIGTNWDFSALKQSEQQLQEANRRLEAATQRAEILAREAEQANVAKSEFLANMSHEIRTPMNGVIGMTGLLLDSDLTEEQQYHAQLVLSSAESLLSLLNDILDFSKMESGRFELDRLNFDLRYLMDEVAATLALQAHEKGLELICAAMPDVPDALLGDPARMRQILLNLVSNAIKFTPAGEVVVRARLLSEDERAAVVRFSVRDTGIGIPTNKQQLLFNKFTQVDASITRQFGGTGLGLAISKQLTELMGGQIGMNSEDGQGAEFWFSVRLDKQAGDRDAAPRDLHGVHVLVVDESATQREVLLAQLTAWGMRVDQAADGPAALRQLEGARLAGNPFQVVILDVRTPGLDGKPLSEILRSESTQPELRLVLLGPLGSAIGGKPLTNPGSVAYLVKPPRHAELRHSLSAVMSGVPVTKTAPVSNGPHAPDATRFFNRAARILLAEDNLTNQQVALGILKKFGLTADVVSNGADALLALKAQDYDLVLMDAQMPEMDGFEATRLIRDPLTQVRHPQVPIIALTAHAMQGDKERCLAAGMNDYLAKPVSPSLLVKTLEKWLPNQDTIVTRPPLDTWVAPAEATRPRQEEQVFNRADLMTRLLDDESLAREIMQGFLEDIPRQLDALTGFVESGDVAAAVRQAHTIKGAAANVGGEALSRVAAEMEQAGRAGDMAATAASLTQLSMEYRRLEEAMKKTLG
jgi:signal transduction histidine kinase/CheY-like chemotaxis protein/HPt (histidine-containing phosphotransfer) domain-containing protein